MINILVVILIALARVDFAVSLSNELLRYARRQGDFNNSSEYNHNLHDLLDTFSSQASDTGFYNPIMSTQTKPASKLYGLYMCRGDIDQETCRVCVKSARKDILDLTEKNYGNARKAAVWYEYCMLRYSDKPFFGKYDHNMMSSSWANEDNKTGDPARFMQILRNTLNSLAINSAYDLSGKRFGTKVVKFTAVDSLYTLVQCTPDLTAIDCYKCLKTAIKQVREMGGSKSGNVKQFNCLVRYEIFPFFESYNNTKALQFPSALNSGEIKLRDLMSILERASRDLPRTAGGIHHMTSPVEAYSLA